MLLSSDLSIFFAKPANPGYALYTADSEFACFLLLNLLVLWFCVTGIMQIKTPKMKRAKREIEKRAPKLVENGKETLILHGTKTSAVLNSVLTELYHLKRGSAVKFLKKNENIRPFESGCETSLEFYSLKTDCNLFVYDAHSKKRPNNLVLGRTYDHHIYDLVEVGV